MLLEYSDKVSSGMKTIGIKRKVDGEIRIYIYIYTRRNVFENNDFKEDWLVNERV